MGAKRICGDCHCQEGQLHEIFCTKELCPFCYRQLVSCECIHTVLDLNDEERQVVEEYMDDFKEPLKSIMARWEQALEAKGRIRFGEDLKILGLEA